MEYILEIEGVSKRFGELRAVDKVSLSIREGELVTLLGPSGCGKTTLLRMVAGFEEPSSGTVKIAGQVVNGVPPDRRPANMVFQRYALFPHLSVFENLAFGLRLRRIDPNEIKKRVAGMLALVRLEGLAERSVTQLSGGESQRVALARALILDPKVLLLDEPLGALDLKIRKQMEVELKRIHQELGATFVYVTHDQEEAMTVSDRIVIMNRGRIVQVGTPEEVYTNPNCGFCAAFVGESNIVPGRVVEVLPETATVDVGRARIQARTTQGCALAVEDAVNILIRPEVLSVSPRSGPVMTDNALDGQVVDKIFLGSSVYYRIDVGMPLLLLAEVHVKEGTSAFQRGEAVALCWAAKDTLVLRD